MKGPLDNLIYDTSIDAGMRVEALLEQLGSED